MKVRTRLLTAALLACLFTLPGQGQGQVQSLVRLSPLQVPVLDTALFSAVGIGLAAPAAQDANSQKGQKKNFGMAVGESLLANFIPWIAVEYGMIWKDLTRMSPTSWLRNYNDWTFDDNHFSVNLLAHPIQGSFYHSAWRTNGYGYWQSLIGTAVGSYLWEIGGESHKPSRNDFFMTTLGGAAVGEGLYRIAWDLLGGPAQRPKLWRRVLGNVANLSRTVSRAVVDEPTGSPWNTFDGKANGWYRTMGVGLRWVGNDIHLRTDQGTQQFLEFDLGYGSVAGLKDGDPPFTFFRWSLEFMRGGDQLVGSGRIRGSLTQFRADADGNWQERFMLFQGLDYQSNSAHEFGGQSLGLAWVGTADFPEAATEIGLTLESRLMGGGVRSKYAYLAEIEGTRERERQYDFAAGPGLGASLELTKGGQRRAMLSWRGDRLYTVNGSNAGLRSSHHVVQSAEVRLNLPIAWQFGIGLDALMFTRASVFCRHSTDPDCENFDSPWNAQYRLYLTWEAAAAFRDEDGNERATVRGIR